MPTDRREPGSFARSTVALRSSSMAAVAGARVELANVGNRSCNLVLTLTALPSWVLPVIDRRAAMSLNDGDDEVAPMEACVELVPGLRRSAKLST
jgi:hypothetical protein